MGVGHTVGGHRVQAERDLVGGHNLLAADVEHRLAQVHRHERDLGHVLPERILARRQGLDVAAVLEQHADVALLDGKGVQQPVGHRRTDDHLEVLVLEADLAGVDHLDGNLRKVVQ